MKLQIFKSKFYTNGINLQTLVAPIVLLILLALLASCVEPGSGNTKKSEEDVCPTVSNTDDPTTDSSGVYQIGDWKQLQWIALNNAKNSLSAKYILTADIAFPDPGKCNFPAYGFVPIGYDTGTNNFFEGTAFSGTFDGNNKTISNFFIDTTIPVNANGDTWTTAGAIIANTTLDDDNIGLFGQIKSTATGVDIKNLTVSLRSIKSTGREIGGVVGWFHTGQAYNIHTRGGSVEGATSVGGVAGLVDSSGSLIGSSTVAVTASVEFAGSLAGNVAGIVIGLASGTVTGGTSLGGLVGKNNNIVIGYTYGTVSGSNNIGGLVGSNDISGTVVGWTVGSITITNIANSYGGLIGTGNGYGHWDKQAAGLPNPAGTGYQTGSSNSSNVTPVSATKNIAYDAGPPVAYADTSGTLAAGDDTAIFTSTEFKNYFDLPTTDHTWPKLKSSFIINTTTYDLSNLPQPTVSDTDENGVIDITF